MPHMLSVLFRSCRDHVLVGSHQMSVHVRVSPDAVVPTALAFDKVPRLGLEAGPIRATRQYGGDSACQRRRVSGRKQETGFTVAYQLAVPADVGGDQHPPL